MQNGDISGEIAKSTTLFFQGGNASDPIYQRTRDSNDDPHPNGRRRIEEVWQECREFVDPDAPSRAMTDLMPVFWELHLAYALKKSGISLVPRTLRALVRGEGPDLAAHAPNVSLEAVMPTNGSGPDALERPVPGTAFNVPNERFVLRLRTSIEFKAARIRKYISDGIIKEGEKTVIAISGAKLEHRFADLPIPRIVRATLGVGNLVVELDRRTGKTTGVSVEHRPEVAKRSGSPVRTDVFLQANYAHVSALLYSYSDWINWPFAPGADFAVVHNPHALNPLPQGWLCVGNEYRLEGETLHRTRHSG